MTQLHQHHKNSHNTVLATNHNSHSLASQNATSLDSSLHHQLAGRFSVAVVSAATRSCSNKKGRGKKTTTFYCKQCDIPMCIVPCFELHHTKVDPIRYYTGYYKHITQLSFCCYLHIPITLIISCLLTLCIITISHKPTPHLCQRSIVQINKVL